MSGEKVGGEGGDDDDDEEEEGEEEEEYDEDDEYDDEDEEDSEEEDDDEGEKFWSNSSYKVVSRGRRSQAMIDFIVPQDKLGQIPGEQFNQDDSGLERRDEWEMQRRGISVDEVVFPWSCSSVVSEMVFEEGVWELSVTVGCAGTLGFVDALFVDERTKVAQSWVTESNIGRAWMLHSAGYVADGSNTEYRKMSKFGPGDHLVLVLDQFEGTVKWTLVNGPPRAMGEIGGIEVPVRLGFQMFKADDWVECTGCRDITNDKSPEERAAGWLLRGNRFLTKAAPLGDGNPENDPEYVRILKISLNALDKASRAYSNLQKPDPETKDASLALFLETKRQIEEVEERIAERHDASKSEPSTSAKPSTAGSAMPGAGYR